MNTKRNEPTITPKYHIEVPTHTHMSPPAVYKVWFGKSYFIWKGKSLLQSATFLAEGIERYLRKAQPDTKNYLHKLCMHIKKTRCIKAHVEVIDSEFTKPGTQESIDVYRMLKVEQGLLKEGQNEPKCLNSVFKAFPPKWMNDIAPSDVAKFNRTWNK